MIFIHQVSSADLLALRESGREEGSNELPALPLSGSVREKNGKLIAPSTHHPCSASRVFLPLLRHLFRELAVG
jgi:hypothetical protein